VPVSLVSRLPAPLAAIAMALHSIVAIVLYVTILLARNVGIRLAVGKVQLVHHLNGNARYAVLPFLTYTDMSVISSIYLLIKYRLI
jgi:hypothetical protein